MQEKLIHQESYKVEEGITELMKGVRTYGINHFLLEYEIIANLIMQHSTQALDMCIRHFLGQLLIRNIKSSLFLIIFKQQYC